MASKIIALSIIMTIANLALFAQTSGLERLRSFDENSYKNRLKNHEKFMPFHSRQQPTTRIRMGKNTINNLKVSEDDMAPMPKMSINKDIKYSMKTLKIRIGSSQNQIEKNEKYLDKKEIEPH